jgi:colicin import membrane protein
MATKKTETIDLFENQENLPVKIDEIASGAGVAEFLMNRAAMDSIIEHVKKEATSEVCDAETDEGRKRMRKIAAAISSSKTLFEKPMADKIREIKAQPKVMTENKTYFIGAMDALRDLVKKPADDWQAEQDRIAQVKQDVVDYFGVVLDGAKRDLPNMPPQAQVKYINSAMVGVEAFDLTPSEELIEKAEEAKRYCLVTLQGYLSYAEKELEKADKAERERIAEIERVANENAAKAHEAKIRQLELDKQIAEQRAQQEQENAERRAQAAAQQARDEESARYAQIQAEQSKPVEAPEKLAEDYIKSVRHATGTALCGLGLTVDQAKAVMNAATKGELHGLQMVY